jgi:hypothetical protein
MKKKYISPLTRKIRIGSRTRLLQSSIPFSIIMYTDESFSRGNDSSWDNDDDVDDDGGWYSPYVYNDAQ